MRVMQKRWGEVTVKRQGEGKNHFDQTKSFSIEETDSKYSIEEYVELLKIITDLTKDYDYSGLIEHLNHLQKNKMIK